MCRFLDSGHLPLSNLYESLLVLSWSFLVIQFFLQINNSFTYVRRKDALHSKQLPRDQFIHFIGVIMSPMALLTYSFAFLNLPKEMQKSTSLVPALQSNWLMMHVTVMILSYAALLCGSVLSMVFLFLNFLEKRNVINKKRIKPLDTGIEKKGFINRKEENFAFSPNQVFLKNENKLGLIESQFSSSGSMTYKMDQDFTDSFDTGVNVSNRNKEYMTENLSYSSLSLSDKFDNYSYRLLALGFPLLTVGILSGAVWANQAWGSYWSWDPKESWALITWLVFAIYLHARITKGWSGEKPAMIATFGFFVVWFCYLGVNLLGAGLHSYGWFSN